MASALDIVTRAMKQRRVLGGSGTPTGAEAADGLVSLNAMLKTWSAQRAMVYHELEESLSLTAGQGSYTIGSGGDLNTVRPTRVADSFVRVGTQDWPVRLISVEEYNAIPDKTTVDIPRVMAYRPTMPLGTLYFYPEPAASATALRLHSWKQLQQFTSLSTDYALPPEYEEAVVFNLARRLSHFGGKLSADDLVIAQEGYNAVRNVNASPRQPISSDLGWMGGHVWSEIP